ncbi:TraR/DksA family transcriptional regulator [Roseovarius sp. S1116L3]|uniref:TraR/DksA family transcriptional regulator n=1 Tax=Roseovarius roseus TaxID=3342636 RepID=UPI003729BA3C
MTEPTEDALRARFLPRLREELIALQEASETTSEHRRPVELDQQSTGRLSRMDALQNQAMAAGSEARRQNRHKSISAAIDRLNKGEFGWCDECGEFIGEKRLDFDPTFAKCVSCADSLR